GAHQQRQFAAFLSRHHQGQRAGPEGGGEVARERGEISVFGGVLIVAHMHDEWIEFGAAFGGENSGDRRIVGRVRAKAIDRLSREREERAALQRLSGGGDSGGVGFAKFGLHASS